MKKSILNTPAFRYIFEIIVIVFSVTLSFYIQDVLNDRDKIELKDIGLEAVLSDLKKDENFYKFGVKGIKRTSLYIDSITDNHSFISSKIFERGVKRYFGFIGQDRNYNSMISTGSIEFIENKDLEETIHLYYTRNYDLMKDFAQQDEKYFNELEKYINSKYDVDILEFDKNGYYNFIYDESVLKKMASDKTLRTLLLQKKWSNHVYIRQMNNSLERIARLKELIDSELNN